MLTSFTNTSMEWEKKESYQILIFHTLISTITHQHIQTSLLTNSFNFFLLSAVLASLKVYLIDFVKLLILGKISRRTFLNNKQLFWAIVKVQLRFWIKYLRSAQIPIFIKNLLCCWKRTYQAAVFCLKLPQIKARHLKLSHPMVI